jgi:hypothetical protein
LASASSDRSRSFAIDLSLTDIEIGRDLDASAFSVRAPSSAEPITLDDVRQSGRMADPGDREP